MNETSEEHPRAEGEDPGRNKLGWRSVGRAGTATHWGQTTLGTRGRDGEKTLLESGHHHSSHHRCQGTKEDGPRKGCPCFLQHLSPLLRLPTVLGHAAKETCVPHSLRLLSQPLNADTFSHIAQTMSMIANACVAIDTAGG